MSHKNERRDLAERLRALADDLDHCGARDPTTGFRCTDYHGHDGEHTHVVMRPGGEARYGGSAWFCGRGMGTVYKIVARWTE